MLSKKSVSDRNHDMMGEEKSDILDIGTKNLPQSVRLTSAFVCREMA